MRNLRKSKGNENKTLHRDFFVFDIETTSLEPIPKNFVFGYIAGYYGDRFMFKYIDSVESFKKEFDNDIWDKEIEDDVNCGKFDTLVQQIKSYTFI